MAKISEVDNQSSRKQSSQSPRVCHLYLYRLDPHILASASLWLPFRTPTPRTETSTRTASSAAIEWLELLQRPRTQFGEDAVEDVSGSRTRNEWEALRGGAACFAASRGEAGGGVAGADGMGNTWRVGSWCELMARGTNVGEGPGNG